MYAKLAFRNACRSVKDYALYIVTLTVLTTIIVFSNLLSSVNNMVDGAQASSLPLIIAVIMAMLLHYINGFMLRRRGRELATYTLLGMKKQTISRMFFSETFLIGLVCFVVGAIVGSLVYFIAMSLASKVVDSGILFYLDGIIVSFLYFVGVQLVSGVLSYIRLSKLQIGQLLVESHKNEGVAKTSKPILWSVLSIISLLIYCILIFVIVDSKDEMLVMMSISMNCVPLLFSIFAFYKCFFLWLNWIRISHKESLYSNNRIYLFAMTLSKLKTDTRLYAVLSLCLLFSVSCFVMGIIIKHMPDTLFSARQAQWMSFIQICLSITFVVIYFSILSVKQIINVQDSRHSLKIIGYLGKNKKQIEKLLLSEACLKFTVPIIVCIIILLVSIFPLNSMINTVLAKENMVMSTVGIFSICFLVLYLLYLGVVYRLCKRV